MRYLKANRDPSSDVGVRSMSESAFSAMSQFRLDGEIALITGSGDGLGRIAALTYGEAGAHVCVSDVDFQLAEKVVREVEEAGGSADAWHLDVMDNDQIIRVINEIAETHKKIDILVNNAGSAQREPTETMPLEVWDRIIQINQTQVFLCSREAGKNMLKRKKGSIINLASIMGLVGGGFYPNFPYHATKGAVVNMTRALAAEWAQRGVRVNAIAPTFVKTNLTLPLRSDKERTKIVLERTPMGRFAEPEELAGPFLFLASSASSMVTGHILAVDGGWTAI